MTLPAMWIRKNMLQSPGPSFNTSDRTLTEAEIKVQRSLQKLSIPEWYLNNSSRPPKILSNDAPIESRPPVWKKHPLNKSMVHDAPVTPARSITVNDNGVLETEIGPPQARVYGTYKKSPTSERNSPLPKKRSAASPKKSSRSRLTNVSRTFPRVSPSRKIQNINIVFPTPPTDNSETLQTTTNVDLEETQIDMSADSLEVTTTTTTAADLETSVSRMPNQRLTYIKPWKSPASSFASPDAKFSTDHNFNLRASSTPHASPIQVVPETRVEKITEESSSLEALKTKKNQQQQQPVSDSQLRQQLTPNVAPRTIRPILAEEEEMCEACRADVSRRSCSPPSSNFRPRSLCPIDEKRPTTRTPKPTRPSGSSETFKEWRKEGKSLVQEIIEELNEKCRTSAQPTYVTPGSKNFVKKLVRALEKGTRLPVPAVDEEAENEEEISEDQEAEQIESGGSEDEAKSAAISTSISYKDTDSNNSSDSELRSPTIKQDFSYDWDSRMEKKNTSDQLTTTEISQPEVEEKDNESVYWIPVTKSKLPRTSSLLSMISRLSSPEDPQVGQDSPCISPIRQTSQGKKTMIRRTSVSNHWGLTYRRNVDGHTRTLRRIDETSVFDSGYSDRSRGHSSGSSDDATWLDDLEATRTASEVGNFSSFSSLGSYGSRRSRAQFVGRPFVI